MRHERLPHQQEAYQKRRETTMEYPEEFTYHMPTGSGKTLLMEDEANEAEGHCLMVFPRLALLSQFYRRYGASLRHRHHLLICTDQKDIRDTCTEDRAIDHYEGKKARAQLRQLDDDDDDESVLILTTYASLPIVMKESEIVFERTLLDEAHHRSESAVATVLDEHRDRFGFIVNLSATPTEDCGGCWHTYPFRQAIEDGVLRDFTVHFIYIDQQTQYEDMAAAVHRIADLTGNRRYMAFTAFADADKENRSSVRKVVQRLQKAGFEAHGITATTRPDERRRILECLSQATSRPTAIVSCRTLGEGIDVHGVNCVVFWDPRSSLREIIQIIGRALRPYRDEDGTILPEQLLSSVIIGVPINVSEYMALPDEDARDQYLRDQASADNGCYESILKVASALKEADPEMAEFCLMYPSGPKTSEAIQKTRETRQKKGYRVIDIEPDGNCFFRSLEPIVGKPHQTIRREVVDRLLEYPKEERVAWGMEDDEHVRDLYKDGVWANEVMDVIPKIAAEMYNLDMSIYIDQTEPLERFTEGDRRIDLQLLNGHYNRLEPIDPENPPEAKKPSRPYRRRFRGHIDPNCRVMWNLCHESLDKGLAVAEHKIVTDGMTFEEHLQILKDWLNQNPQKRPNSKSDNHMERRLGQWCNIQNRNYHKLKDGMKDNDHRKQWGDLIASYPEILIYKPNTKWDEQFHVVKEFLHHNPNRRPNSNSDNHMERRLGQWCNIQNRDYYKWKDGMKDDDHRKQWENLVAKHPKAMAFTYEYCMKFYRKWDEQFQTLKHLLDQIPNLLLDFNSKNPIMRRWSRWCINQIKNIKNWQQEVTSDKIKEIKEIATLIKNPDIDDWCKFLSLAQFHAIFMISCHKELKNLIATYPDALGRISDSNPIQPSLTYSRISSQCIPNPPPPKKLHANLHPTKSKKKNHEARIKDQLDRMTEDEMKEYILRKKLEDVRAKRGEYLAPNKAMKDRINHHLKDLLPKKGQIIVLDAEDFGTTTVLGEENAHRMIIPQRDLTTYTQMRQHPVFGSCVRHCDLADVDLKTCSRIGLIYADLMGSISELRPLLQKFAEAQYVDGAVVAATISCRDGSNESAFINQFAEQLTYAMAEALFGMGFRRAMDAMVYGESMRMATAIFLVLDELKYD